jgi:hypothetical protein
MFVLRSKHRDLQARHERLVRLLATTREQLADWKGSAIRTAGRNTALSERLEVARGAVLADNEYVGQLETRLFRLLRACVRYRATVWRLERDNARLQRRLDDAVGLTSSGIADSSSWQPGFETPKPKAGAR